jgi:hypothetical protein
MSIDAGGLAQMTYQSPFDHSIGISGPGFASRGKATHIKRLSVAPPPKISTIDETQQFNVNSAATPRTSRGHLLAGLRTAPKSATTPNSNPGFGLENSKYAAPQYNYRTPQSTTHPSFPNQYMGMNSGPQLFSKPEQVLAPPAIDFDGDGAEQMDQNIYNELVATNAYLAQQQRALQQQLANVTAAAHQLGGLNLNGSMYHGQSFQPQVNSPMSFYNQQFQHGLQPIVQPVPNSPGVFTVYNPMTGQSSFFVDNSQPGRDSPSPPFMSNTQSPIQSPPTFQRQYSPQRESTLSPVHTLSRSPPKSTPSPPQDVEPLPPPSANAFRRGHKKGLSSVSGMKTNSDWNKSTPRSAGFPQTPLQGTFGPGQGRAGEHPVRQPRGPPLLQELEEKPTSKHEGSKNFATRQRRRAVHDLVRAGRERRSETRQPGSGSGTPGSESEFTFSVSPSDTDDVLVRSTSLSSKPSLGSLRAAASGAIGSERKEKSRDRGSVDSSSAYSAKSLSSDEGNSVGGSMVEVESARRGTPMLVLSSAEKRKSVIM